MVPTTTWPLLNRWDLLLCSFRPVIPPSVSLFTSLLRSSLVAQMVKRLPTIQETWVGSLGREDLLEQEMATHSSILAWKIPWTEEPGRLQSTGSQRVGHDWATSLLVLFKKFNINKSRRNFKYYLTKANICVFFNVALTCVKRFESSSREQCFLKTSWRGQCFRTEETHKMKTYLEENSGTISLFLNDFLKPELMC